MMSPALTIYVEKLNETYLRISADEGILRSLSEQFVFQVPGYRHMPSYRSGQWDGYIRLFNEINGLLYVGLFSKVFHFAKENNYPLEYVQNELYHKPFYKGKVSDEVLDSFIKSLQVQSDGEDLDTRDYQIEAIRASLENRRITLVSPTASGKSYIIYALIRWYLEEDRKILLIVPTTSLVEQMYADFRDYSTANGFDVEENAQILYSGKSKVLSTNVMITTWQSIQDEKKGFFEQFTVVIGDEAHGFKANKLKSIMEKCIYCDVRIAMTGTMPKDQSQILTISGLFGSVYEVISTRALMDLGFISDLDITCILLNYDHDTAKMIAKNKFDYKAEIDYIVTNENRNKRIANLAANLKGNTIVIFNFVEKQGKPLYDMLKDTDNKNVYFIHGSVKVAERERIRLEAKDIDNGLYIVSFGTFSTGINMPSIQNIIIASPVKSNIRLLQSIGRGLRLFKGKEKCNLYDIGDNFKATPKSKNNITLNHYISRIGIYDEQQFSYRIKEVEFHG